MISPRNCIGNPYGSVWQRKVGNYELRRGKPQKEYVVVI